MKRVIWLVDENEMKDFVFCICLT